MVAPGTRSERECSYIAFYCVLVMKCTVCIAICALHFLFLVFLHCIFCSYKMYTFRTVHDCHVIYQKYFSSLEMLLWGESSNLDYICSLKHYPRISLHTGDWWCSCICSLENSVFQVWYELGISAKYYGCKTKSYNWS